MTRKLPGVVLLAVICSSLLAGDLVLKQAQQEQIYQTELGTLKASFSIMAGASIVPRPNSSKMGDFVVDFGYVRIDKGLGMRLSGPLDVITEKAPFPVGSRKEITVVQDKKTLQWIATDGVLATTFESPKVVEGHVIHVVGGQKNPITICGKTFADTTLVISKGDPVPQKK